MAITNTGAVERTITGVNTSDLFLDESNSTITNTGAVERDIEASHDANFVHPLGDELILNGTFDADSIWSKGTGWSIGDGKASCDGTQTSTSTLQTSVGISGIQNELVSISFEVSNYSAGLIDATLEGSGQIDFDNISSNGVYSAQITSSDTSPKLLFNANADFIGSIDNISVKEVLVNRESDITNTGVVIRDIEGVNESDEMFPDNTESNITNLSEGSGNEGGGGFSIDEEEAGNDVVNGRMNENADGYILSQPDWSWVDGAIQYDGTGESYFGIQKTRVGAVGMSSVNQILRFEVLEGEFFTNASAIDSNIILTSATYGVGVHEINPMQMINFGGTEPTIYIRSSVTGSRIDNIFLQPA